MSEAAMVTPDACVALGAGTGGIKVVVGRASHAISHGGLPAGGATISSRLL